MSGWAAVTRRVRRAIGRAGSGDGASAEYPPDFDQAAIALHRRVKPFTMTSRERVLALRQSVEYVVRNQIPGAFVECGVWKGGSAMAIALTLLELGVSDRMLYLFDTFSGMPAPSEEDRAYTGESADAFMEQAVRRGSAITDVSSLGDVKRALVSTGYDAARTILVEGKVENTIPAAAPGQIALLRLDTDWYESTYHELIHLYPRLSVGGVLIIDDYGHWQGARKAVDQFIAERHLKLLLSRIDYTGRMCVKIEA